MPPSPFVQPNAPDNSTFLIDQPATAGAYDRPEERRLREGVRVQIDGTSTTAQGDFQFLADIQAKADALALYVGGLKAQGTASSFPVTIEWALLAGTDCSIDYDTPLFQGVTILADANPRQGLLVASRGFLASRWQLWARITDPNDAPNFIFALSGLVALNGSGSDPVIETGSAIGQ